MASLPESKRSENKQCTVFAIFSFIPFSAFSVLFQRGVVNIPIKTLIFSPWFLLRKRIISQLELGLPVGRRANFDKLIADVYLSHLFFFRYESHLGKVVNFSGEKNHRKFETTTGKQTFAFNYQGRTRWKNMSVMTLCIT